MSKRIYSMQALLVFVLALTGVQAAVADGGPGKTLVGTWVVNIVPDGPVPPTVDITVVNRDGTMSNSDALLGTGHGIWRRLGDSVFEMKFTTPVIAFTGTAFPPGVTLTVTTRDLAVDKGGLTASGRFSADFEPDQATFPDFTGAINFTRMTFED
jgi:hypothetical protein